MVGDLNNHTAFSTFPSALLMSESSSFKAHLKSRSAEISSAISQIFAQGPATSPEIVDLQERITHLLAAEKSHLIEIEKSRQESKMLEERLEAAALRYMIAEKKLDRSKSATVAKLERQAISGGRNDSGSGLGGGMEVDSNGDLSGDTAEQLLEAEAARKVAVAESTKRQDQLESLESENEKLTIQVRTLTNRLSHLSDDDYSKTDLFKHLKAQHEDVIKRINDLEATNVQLRKEAEQLQAERTAYRIQIEKESEMAIAEKEAQLAQAENDLARIRTSRDDLTADVSMRKAAQAQERTSIDQVKELAHAKEERVKALESEITRLKLTNGQTSGPAGLPASLEGLSAEGLQNRCSNLEKQYSLLNTELSSMGIAFKKASTLASQKLTNISALEEKTQRLSAEKSKADQKYFAAMKVKEAREQEVRTLRAQNSKSSEMVSQLKDSESASRALQVNLEKQIAEARDSLTAIESKLRTAQQQLTERNILSEGFKTQVEELKKNLLAKDETTGARSTALRKAEVEIESLKVRLEVTKKSLDSWKTKGLGNQSGEYEMLRVSLSHFPFPDNPHVVRSLCEHIFPSHNRLLTQNPTSHQTLAICNVCRINFKTTAIKTCGHVFCKECVEERTASRSRKCPNCSKSFGAGDVMKITL